MELTVKIMESVDRICRKMYERYQPTSIDVDDLKQECYIHLLSSDHLVNIEGSIISKCKTIIRNSGYSFTVPKSDLKTNMSEYYADDISRHKNDLRYECNMNVAEVPTHIIKALSILTDREQVLLYVRFFLMYDLIVGDNAQSVIA